MINVNVFRALIVTLSIIFSCNLHAEQYVNDFKCTLNESHTIPQLLSFQAEYMAAAREAGFDENYYTEMLFPVYNDDTSTQPLHFIWRGHFKDSKQLGELLGWFVPNQEWVAKFGQIMECGSASLWTKP